MAVPTAGSASLTPTRSPTNSPVVTQTPLPSSESSTSPPHPTQTESLAEILTSLPTSDPGQDQLTREADDEPLPEVIGFLRISTIQISQHRVMVGGHGNLPDGTCIFTRLLTGSSSVEWWPDDYCAELVDTEWQLELDLGAGEERRQLDESLFYQLEAWANVDPVIEAAPFTFDLAGPPDL